MRDSTNEGKTTTAIAGEISGNLSETSSLLRLAKPPPTKLLVHPIWPVLYEPGDNARAEQVKENFNAIKDQKARESLIDVLRESLR